MELMTWEYQAGPKAQAEGAGRSYRQMVFLFKTKTWTWAATTLPSDPQGPAKALAGNRSLDKQCAIYSLLKNAEHTAVCQFVPDARNIATDK